MGHLHSEGVYEDIGAVPMGEKDEGPSVPWDLVLEEQYDDAWEPERDLEDEDEEDEDGDEDEDEDEDGWPRLSPMGAHLCAMLPTVLFLIYCSCAQGPAPGSAYI